MKSSIVPNVIPDPRPELLERAADAGRVATARRVAECARIDGISENDDKAGAVAIEVSELKLAETAGAAQLVSLHAEVTSAESRLSAMESKLSRHYAAPANLRAVDPMVLALVLATVGLAALVAKHFTGLSADLVLGSVCAAAIGYVALTALPVWVRLGLQRLHHDIAYWRSARSIRQIEEQILRLQQDLRQAEAAQKTGESGSKELEQYLSLIYSREHRLAQLALQKTRQAQLSTNSSTTANTMTSGGDPYEAVSA